MEQKHLEFILTAKQPIAHLSETFGNTSVLARRKVRQPDGDWAHVPVISGDAMRHGMREASSYVFLNAAGLLDEGKLSEAALRLLFSGGQVRGSAGGVTKLNDYREMIDLVPTLALFGGCAQNRIIPGRLWVEDAVLICKEEEHLLPEWVLEHMASAGGLQSHRAHVEEAQRVRMDPVLEPQKRKLLTAKAREGVEHRLLKSETAAELDDAVEKEATKSAMLPRTFERIAQGSLFHWSVTANCYSDLDVDTFYVACAAFLAAPRVGGKLGTGHGLLQVVVGRDVKVLQPVERASVIKPDQLSTAKVGDVFRAHVKKRAKKIADFLSVVEA